MAHKDFPYKFNDTVILWPLTWEEKPNVVEDVQSSEAGTDLVMVKRTDKLSVSCSFKVSSAWLEILKAFSEEDSFQLSRYDGTTQGYDVRTVRMRGYSQNRIRWSEVTDGGLWEVSFTLEEF